MTATGRKIGNQSTRVVFQIIEEMARIGEAARLTDIARRVGMPKARVYRFLQSLLSIGYVWQDPETDRYGLTLKLFHIGQAISDTTPITSLARPEMLALRDACRHTTTLSLPEPAGMRVIEIVRTDSPVQIVTRPGALLAFHASAQGKLALAFGDPACWDVVREGPLEPVTSKTNTDPARLESETARVRRRGWAVAPEEILHGVNALAAPILDKDNALAATITIAGSVQDIRPEPDPMLIARVLGAARAVSASLGCTEYPV